MDSPLLQSAFSTSQLRIVSPAFLLFVLTLLATGASAETTSNSGANFIPLSTSASFTYTITTPGTWYLKQDYTVNLASGVFITVAVSNVTIDFNGHTVTNTNGTGTGALAVYSSDVANITIRNGNINGFFYGVFLNSSVFNNAATAASYGQLVEDMCFTKCTYCGVLTYGVSNRIHRCRSVLVGNPSTNGLAFGFNTWGLYNTIEDCDVMGCLSTGTTYGVIVGLVNSSGYSFAVNNRVSGVMNGVWLKEQSDKYRDTLTAAVTNAYTSNQTLIPSQDAGGNH